MSLLLFTVQKNYRKAYLFIHQFMMRVKSKLRCVSREWKVYLSIALCSTDLLQAMKEVVSSIGKYAIILEGKSFDLIIDIYSPRSLIETLIPEQLSNAIFRYVYAMHNDCVKIMFVALSDCQNVKIGRSICFPVEGASQPIDTIDGYHVVIMYPPPDLIKNCDRVGEPIELT